MSAAIEILREERKKIQLELKKIERAIRALGGKKRGRKPGSGRKKTARKGKPKKEAGSSEG